MIEDYEGDLLEFKNSCLDLLVTPNHNMWVFDYNKRSPLERVWKFIRAEDMKNSAYKFEMGGEWKGINDEVLILPDETELVSGIGKGDIRYKGFTLPMVLALKLVGLWISDGSLSLPSTGSGRKLYIHQKKEWVRIEIKSLLDELHLDLLS